jgi:hypothetical protein
MGANYFCHICGFSLGAEAPWGANGLLPSFIICDCCGVEYGYEDCLQTGVEKYRQEWLSTGASWSNPKAKPLDWSLERQLGQIPKMLPAGIRHK